MLRLPTRLHAPRLNRLAAILVLACLGAAEVGALGAVGGAADGLPGAEGAQSAWTPGDAGGASGTPEASDALDRPGLSLAWLAGAEPQPFTFLYPGLDEPVTVYAKAPPQPMEADGLHVLMPCTPEMKASLDPALCDLSIEVLRHPEAFLGDPWLPVLIEVPDAVPLEQARQAIAGAGIASGVGLLPLVHMLTAQVHMGQLDALVREPLSGVADFVWLDRPVAPTLDHSVAQVGADDVWAMRDASGRPVAGRGTTIAILDTGVNHRHADLGGCTDAQFDAGQCRIARWAVFTGESCARPCDGHGHGTHVAATAAGNGTFKGVAPEATIWAGKVLDNGGSGSYSGIIAGIEWASTNGADVISMSLGGGCSPCDGSDPLSQAVDAATARGTLVVVAAGNSGPATPSVGTPAVAATALTVGAVDDADLLASFSSRGPTQDLRTKPEIVAPGVAICAAAAGAYAPNCGPAHRALSGTSMATPHVSGAAALVLQMHPDWTPAQVKSALVQSAHDTGLFPREQGAGRLDAPRAVQAPLLLDRAVLDFGNLGTADQATRTVTISNPGASAITVGVGVGLARTFGQTATFDVLDASASSVVVPGSGSATLGFTLDLTGIAGTFEGVVTLTVGGSAYRLPYSGSHLSLIRVAPELGGAGRYHYAVLGDADYDPVARSSGGTTSSFWVLPGTYHVFAYNSPIDSPVFVARETVTVGIGDEALVPIDLDAVPTYTIEARDTLGRRIQVDSDSNALRVMQGATEKLRFSYGASFFLQDGATVRLHNLDLAGTGFEAQYMKSHLGTYVPECTTPYFARTAAVRDRCSGAFDTSSEYLLSGTIVSNPNPAARTHTWTPAAGLGPFRQTYDSHHAGVSPLRGADLMLPGSQFGILFLGKAFQGLDRDLYFANDDRWGLFVHASDTGGALERNVAYRWNPATDADDLRFFGSPVQLAGLVTDGTRLASERHAFFAPAQESFYARTGLLRHHDQQVGDRPRLQLYRDGVLVRDATVGWDQNVDALAQALSPGHSYQARLTLPDGGWGTVKQTHTFTYGVQTPRILSVDHPTSFKMGRPYEVAVTAADSNAAVTIEFGQGGLWTAVPATQAGAVHTASFSPAASSALGLRVTVTANGASTALEYGAAAVLAVPLTFTVTKTANTVSGTCSYLTGGACPDVAVRLLCNGVDVRGGYFRAGTMDAVSMACGGTVTAKFAGSGPFIQQLPPPTVKITRPTGANTYVNDAVHPRQAKVADLGQVDGITLDPGNALHALGEPWIWGNLTIRWTVTGAVDTVDLYIQDQHKASLPISPNGAYSWLWTADDQFENHAAGSAPIRVEAANMGSSAVAVQNTLLLSAPPGELTTPHFDGVGAWEQIYVSGPGPIAIDPLAPVAIDPSDSITLDATDPIDIGPVAPRYFSGAVTLSTRADKGAFIGTDDAGRLVEVPVEGVAWTYSALPAWNPTAWAVAVEMEGPDDRLMSLRGAWTPALLLSACTASHPSNCLHYGFGPMTLLGDGPDWGSTAQVEGLHGAYICTSGSAILNVQGPCGGPAAPPVALLEQLLGCGCIHVTDVPLSDLP